jgi:Glycosyl transferase family 2
MRVSVVVPLFDKGAYVRRCVESIRAQTLGDFEIIVVNDGSRDGGERAVESIDEPRLRVLHQANAGPGAARNRGLREARGDYVAFLDADDEWLPAYLEHGVRELDRHPEAATVTSCYVEHPSRRHVEGMWRRRGISDGLHRVTSQLAPRALVYMLAYMLPCTTVARTEAVRAYGGFYDKDRCRYAEDAHLWLQVLLNRPVLFSLESLVRIDRDTAELSGNLGACRPIEPFLTRPEGLRASCPEDLRPLLEGFLAARAFKTACVLGYWGHWREARELRARFDVRGGWRLPYALPSLVCSTPVGSWMGSAWRGSRK